MSISQQASFHLPFSPHTYHFNYLLFSSQATLSLWGPTILPIFCPVFSHQPSHKFPWSYLVQIYDSNYTHSLTRTHPLIQTTFNAWNGGPTNGLLSPIMHRRKKTACLVPTSAFLKPGPDMAVLFALFDAPTHPPLPALAFSLYLQSTLPEVTSWLESWLQTEIGSLGSQSSKN